MKRFRLRDLRDRYNELFSNNNPHDEYRSVSVTGEDVLPRSRFRLISRSIQNVIYYTVLILIALGIHSVVWINLQSDSNTQRLINLIEPCPCYVGTTWKQQQTGFQADQACDGRRKSFMSCWLHRGATGCYRRQSTRSDAGAQCCYNSQGVWIKNWRDGAGTLDAVSPDKSKLKHFFNDVLSYFSCCYGIAAIFNGCEHYMRYRPPGRCQNCHPMSTDRINDLPFSTFSRHSYTSYNQGEYVLFKKSTIPLEIQIRIASLTSEFSLFNVNEMMGIVAFVIQSGDKSRVQFELDSRYKSLRIRIGERILNLSLVKEDSNECCLSSLVIYSDGDHLIIRRYKLTKFHILFNENKVHIHVNVPHSLASLGLSIIIPRSILKGEFSRGLLGELNEQNFTDTTAILTMSDDDLLEHRELCRTACKSSLFIYELFDSHAQHQDYTYRPLHHFDLIAKKSININQNEITEMSCQNVMNRVQCISAILKMSTDSLAFRYLKNRNNAINWETYAELIETDQEQATEVTVTSLTALLLRTKGLSRTARTN